MSNGTRALHAPLRLWAALLLLALGLLTAIPALAQTGNSVITGTVTDTSSKAPVADVVVTATSPALQGEQLVVTDGSGQFRIPNLPSGDYSLRLEKETYRPYSRGGITIRTATTIRVNVELLPDTLKAEEILVVGRPPTVDVGSSSTAQNINQDFTRRIAIAPPSTKNAANRSFESVAEIAPGAHSDDFGTSINGTSSPENQYVIDGLSVNDPAYGIIGTPLTMEFIKEVNVVSGGYMPEFGRATGGVLDVVTKSGSNEFHGSVFFNITPGAFEAEATKVRRQGNTISTDARLSSIRDYGFEIGGPIVKDKLWFFAGMDAAFTDRTMERTLFATQYEGDDTLTTLKDPETGFNVVNALPGTQRFYRAQSQTLQYMGKLTYQFNQDHSIALSLYGSPGEAGGDGTFGFDPQRGVIETANIAGTYQGIASKYISSATDVALKWASAFDNKNVLFDATLGWHHQRNAQLPSDGSELGTSNGLAGTPAVTWARTRTPVTPERPSLGRHSIAEFESLSPEAQKLCERTYVDGTPRVPCQVATYAAGGTGFIDDASLDRFQLKAMVTSIFQALGHHVVKGGLDAEIMMYDHAKAYTGKTAFRESPDGSFFQDIRQYGFLTGPEVDQYVLQPKAEASSLSTTIGGFVQDSWNLLDKVTLNIGLRYDAQYLFNNDGDLGMGLPNQWSPRLGVVYDVTQQGRSKIFANYARYYESVPLDVVDRAFGDERQARSYHASDSCNPLDPAEAVRQDGVDDAQQAKCHQHQNRLNGNDLGGLTATYDPNQAWSPTGGGKTPVDPDISPQSSDELVLGGEYEVIPNGRLGATYTKRWMNNVIEDMSRDEGSTYFIGNPGKGIAVDFPEAKRDYDAGTFYFQKAFVDMWLAQASYTVSYLRGNYAGLFRPETLQLDPNINSDFDLVSLLANREGTLPADRTHEIKLFGAKAFNIPGGMLVDVGLTVRTRSGGPTDYWGAHPAYGPDESFILPRGSGERLPWVHNLDTHIGYSLKLAKDSELTVSMDLFNILNFQAVTATDQRYTLTSVNPCRGGTLAQLEPAVEGVASCLTNDDGSPFNTATDKNPNFGKPTQYQAPRAFRFGARVTF